MQIFNDLRTAYQSPPTSPVEQRILYARIRAYWSRCEFILWNFVGIGLLYMFSDSLLNQYLRAHQYYMNALFHIIQSIAGIAYFITSFKDPGYVTLKDPQNAEQQQLMFDISSSDEDSPHDASDDKKATKECDHSLQYIEMNDANYDPKHKEFKVVSYIPEYNRHITIDRHFESTWPSNFCDQCVFIRPIRSKHCFFCGRCVSKFDHHCPLVGNCVAGGNYRFFLVFLLFESILILWSFYMSINVLFVISIDDMDGGRGHDMWYRHSAMGWAFRIIFFVVMFMFLFSIIGLTGFHFYLLFTNQTTMELMRPDSIDRYLHEEFKKKDEYRKKHRKHLEDEKQKHNDEDEKQRQIRRNNSDAGEYQYRFYGNITSYRTYFDEGWMRNLMLALTGTVKAEWKTPLKCKYRANEAENA